MQTYLQPSTLKDLGITFFDGWAADFGETVTSMELSPSGQGYRARTRFAKFTNLPELLKLYRAFADVQTADMVKLNVPEAERHVVNLKPSDTTIELAEEIADRADKIYGGGVDSHIDNMLKVTSDGKKLALDPRCFVPTCKDEEGSKLNACAQNIYEIWSDTSDIKGTQIVFCDLSTPKSRFEDYVYGTDFDAYNDLKYKLVQKGIPSEEIAFIHDAGYASLSAARKSAARELTYKSGLWHFIISTHHTAPAIWNKERGVLSGKVIPMKKYRFLPMLQSVHSTAIPIRFWRISSVSSHR